MDGSEADADLVSALLRKSSYSYAKLTSIF